MKRIFLHWFPIVTLIASLNLLSCGSSGGEEGSSSGPLDGKFGKDGKVTTAIGSIDDEAYGLVIQADGKLVAAGYTNYGTQSNPLHKFALVRYNTDGTLDTTFGTGGTGIVTTDINGINDVALALVIQPDNKLVAAGFTDTGSQNEFALVRYNTDGTLDTSFGTGGTGIVTTSIGAVDDEAFALVIQPSDGKLVAAGYSNNGSQRIFALVRYNTNGTPDAGFGSAGIVTTLIGSKDQAFALAIQPNGKLVAAGFSTITSSGAVVFALARYNTNGSLDTTGFNPTGTIPGVVTTPIGDGEDDEIHSIAVLSNGKLVAAGYSHNGSQYVIALVRYNTDGSLDPTFGLTGIVTTASTPLGKSNFAYALALQQNGKLVTAGYSSSGNQQNQGVFINKFAVVRYNPTGSQDDSFSSKGIAVTSIDNFDDEAFALALETVVSGTQQKTKQVTAGKSYDKTTGTYQFGLIRYAPSSD